MVDYKSRLENRIRITNPYDEGFIRELSDLAQWIVDEEHNPERQHKIFKIVRRMAIAKIRENSLGKFEEGLIEYLRLYVTSKE